MTQVTVQRDSNHPPNLRGQALFAAMVLTGVGVVVVCLYFLLVLLVPAWFAPEDVLPLAFPYYTYVDKSGTRAGEPVNIVIRADNEQQLLDAFYKCDWIRVPLLGEGGTKFDFFKGVTPISPRYVQGRVHDHGFQHPTHNIAVRHHLRIWRYEKDAKDGKLQWLVAASYDKGVFFNPFRLLPTHIVSPNLDDERDFVTDELTEKSLVASLEVARGIGPYLFKWNGDVSFYYTDGDVAVVTLGVPPDGRVSIEPVHWAIRVRRRFFDLPTQILQVFDLAESFA